MKQHLDLLAPRHLCPVPNLLDSLCMIPWTVLQVFRVPSACGGGAGGGGPWGAVWRYFEAHGAEPGLDGEQRIGVGSGNRPTASPPLAAVVMTQVVPAAAVMVPGGSGLGWGLYGMLLVRRQESRKQKCAGCMQL